MKNLYAKLLLGFLLLTGGHAMAQYAITGTGSGNTYVQDFDAFRGTAATLPANWAVVTASYNTTYPVITSGAASPTVANASGNNVYAGRASSTSTDYAIVQKQGTSGSTTFTFSAKNTTGAVIDGFVINWNVEQYASAGRATTVDLKYRINSGAYVTTGITGTNLFTATTGSSTTFSVVQTARSITITGLTLADLSTIDFQFSITNGSGSGSNAHIGIDDFNVYATTPAVCAAPSTQASAIVFPTVNSTSLVVNWTNGSGGGRIVKMNTTNTFTTPANTSNPTASLAWANAGEQVVYNGTGSGPITVTGLSGSTQYFFRVYEYCTPDRTYQTATATNNPNSQTTATVTSPTLSATALTAFGSQCINNTYGPNMFTITGSNLDGTSITVAALAGYTYSTTAAGTYTTTLTLPAPAGAYTQDVYVKFTPVAATSYIGNIVISGGGATAINEGASGTGINTAPSVVTVTATAISITTASSGGNSITSACGTITAKGVVWGTTANPTVPSVSSTNDGTGTASYTSAITGLTQNTLYHYRAYVTNSNGITSYGADLSFTTLKAEPGNFPSAFACGTTTQTAIPLTWTDATAGVIPDGYLVKWSNTSYAAIVDPVDGIAEADGATTKNIAQGIGAYTASGLTGATTYYFEIWSYTNSGTNINYKLVGEPQTSCTTQSAPWEDFETGTKGSYATGSVTCTAGSWTFNEAVIGNTAGSDKFNGTQSARIRSTGEIDMNFNITNGLGTVQLLYGMYGSDIGCTWRLEASTDDGATWTAYVSPTITTTTGQALTSQLFTLNIGGNVRFRIIKLSGGTSNRLNIDDIYITSYAVPEINVKGNNVSIPSGSTTPTTANFTDFGNANITGGTVVRTFTIENLGLANLNLTGTPVVAISGTNAADFTVTTVPATTTLAASGTATFQVTFDPSALGIRTATISIASNDADENPYTFAIQGTGVNSNTSDIIADPAFTYTSNIDYTLYQGNPASNTTNSVGAFKFIIRDGAGVADADALGTELNSITFSVANIANIRSAALFGGALQTTLINNTPVINTGTGTITFTGLSGANVTAADDGTQSVTLRVSFLTTVTDNQQLQYTISAASANAAGSVFATANAGAATSSITGDRNRIEVTADRLSFVQQPSNTSQGTNMTPAVTVQATDVNLNRDLDIVSGSVSITSSGTLSASPQTATPVAGLATFTTINHTAPGLGLTLTATYPGLSPATSNTFNITAFIYANGDYRPSISNTDFSINGTWESYSGGTWTTGVTAPQNLPSGSKPTRIIIDKTGIGGAGNATNAYNSIIVTSGGELILQNDITPTANFVSSGNFEVQSGGLVTLNGQIGLSGTVNFILRNGATFNVNNASISNNHPFWGGVEDFEAGSVFYITNHRSDGNASASLINVYNQVSDNITGSKFGTLKINFTPASEWVIVGGPTNLILCDSLNITNGSSTVPMIMFSNNSNPSAQIRGSVVHNGGYFALSGNFSSTTTGQTLSIDGSLNSLAGILKLYYSGGGTAANININVKGNVNIAGTAFSSDVNNTTKLNFTGTSLQALSVVPNCSFVNFVVKSGASVQLQNQNLNLNGSSLFSVESTGMFDFGFSGTTALKINQSGGSSNSFTSASGSYLKITSPFGLNTNAGGLGNLENLPASGRNVNILGTFHYMGKANQVTGNAITTGGNAKTIICELVDNTTQLSFTNNTSIVTPGLLDIRVGQVIESTTAYLTGSTGDLKMATGTYYKIVKGNSSKTLSDADVIPRVTGTYTITGGTIELAGTGTADSVQTLRGSRTYANLSFTNGGYKYASSGITGSNYIKGTLLVADATVFNAENRTMGDATVASGNATSITMTGTSKYITAGTGTKPDAQGTYSLGAGTTVEFNNNLTSTEDIRLSPAYYNIIVSGSSVANPSLTSTPVGIQGGGAFTVTGTGTFKHANINGFSGAANTAISTTNNPTITLSDGSTIDYYRNDGAGQTISNATNVGRGSSNYYNLSFSGSGVKTLPAADVTINGNLYRADLHTVNPSTGRFIFSSSTTAQKYYAATGTVPFSFYNVTVDNSSATGLSVDSTAGVLSELKINSTSKLKLNTGNVILHSSFAQTASLANLGTNTAAISYGTGRFTIERFINIGTNNAINHGKGWQFIATPVQSDPLVTVKNNWQENNTAPSGYGTWITGDVAGGGFDAQTAGPSLKSYLTLIDAWQSAANTTSAITEKRGYMLYVRGDRSVTNSSIVATTPTILRLTGKVNDAATIPASTTVAYNKFESIGNPYPSAIDFVYLRTNLSTNIDNRFYVWDPMLGSAHTGGYQVFDAATGFVPSAGATFNYSGPNTTIQSGQAFFVRNSFVPAGGTVTWSEAVKVSGSNLVNRIETGIVSMLSTSLVAANGNTADGNRVIFDNDYSNNIDGNDAIKITNTVENFGLLSNSRALSIEARKQIVSADTIFYKMSGLAESSYKLVFAAQNISTAGIRAELVDQYTNQRTPVSLTDSSFITINVTSEAASKAADRFMLVFKPVLAPLPVTITSVAASRNADRTIAVNWTVENELNIQQYVVERSADGISFTGIINTAAINSRAYAKNDLSPLAADNFYRIKAMSLGGQVQYSAVVKVAPLSQTKSISVYPNPVINKTVQVQFINQSKGAYQLQLSNKLGQAMYKGSVQVNSGASVQTIHLEANTAPGIYQLVVTNTEGKTNTIQVVIE